MFNETILYLERCMTIWVTACAITGFPVIHALITKKDLKTRNGYLFLVFVLLFLVTFSMYYILFYLAYG